MLRKILKKVALVLTLIFQLVRIFFSDPISTYAANDQQACNLTLKASQFLIDAVNNAPNDQTIPKGSLNIGQDGKTDGNLVPDQLYFGITPLDSKGKSEWQGVFFYIVTSDKTQQFNYQIIIDGVALDSSIAGDTFSTGNDGALLNKDSTGKIVSFPYLPLSNKASNEGTHNLVVTRTGNGVNNQQTCTSNYTIKPDPTLGVTCTINWGFDPQKGIDDSTKITVSGKITPPPTKILSFLTGYYLNISGSNNTNQLISIDQDSDGKITSKTPALGPFTAGNYTISLIQRVLRATSTAHIGAIPIAVPANTEDRTIPSCGTQLSVVPQGQQGGTIKTINGGHDVVANNPGQIDTIPSFSCSNGPCTKSAGKIETCGVQTAIGCIPTNPVALINAFLKFSLAAAGGIALLLMGIAGVEIITSAGNAEALKNAHGRFTQAIIGLIFVVMATLFLQIIGVDILRILQK